MNLKDEMLKDLELMKESINVNCFASREVSIVNSKFEDLIIYIKAFEDKL